MNKYRKLSTILAASICFIIGFISGTYVGIKKGIPFVGKQNKWSIGIYIGNTPFKFFDPGNINNPVLTYKDVKDVPADFVADPFMIRKDNIWYMFFEVMNKQTR